MSQIFRESTHKSTFGFSRYSSKVSKYHPGSRLPLVSLVVPYLYFLIVGAEPTLEGKPVYWYIALCVLTVLTVDKHELSQFLKTISLQTVWRKLHQVLVMGIDQPQAGGLIVTL